MNSKEKREAARSWAIENHLVSRGNPIILIVCGENVRALYYLLVNSKHGLCDQDKSYVYAWKDDFLKGCFINPIKLFKIDSTSFASHVSCKVIILQTFLFPENKETHTFLIQV